MLNKSLLLTALTGLFLSTAVLDVQAVQARPQCGNNKEKKHKEKDCLADTTWIFDVNFQSQTGELVQVFGSLHFERHGGLWGADSADIGQTGFFGTPWVGQWKKIGKRKYKFFETNVLSLPDQARPGFTIPTFRLKVEATVEVSKDCKCLTSVDARLLFYALCDWELSCPLNTVPASLNAKRVGFKNPPCDGSINQPPCVPPCGVQVH